MRRPRATAMAAATATAARWSSRFRLAAPPTTRTTWRSRASFAARADRRPRRVTDGGAFEDTRAEILARIQAAAARAGREPEAVEIVAVTKTVEAPRILAAIAAGFTSLGENRVQQRAEKVAEIDAVSTYPAGSAPRWHLVGPLQSNKARRAVELFDVIETVDTLDLARRLDRIAGEVGPLAGEVRP